MDFLTPEMETAAYAFVAVLAANAVRWTWRWAQAYAASTPNKFDDKLVAAVRKGIEQVMDEVYEEDDNMPKGPEQTD